MLQAINYSPEGKNMEISVVVFAAIFLGVLSRAFLPYLRKLIDGEKLVFQARYLAIVIASFITVWTAFPTYSPVLDGWMQTATAAFTFGFGMQALYTEAYHWLSTGYAKTQSSPP